MTRYVLDDLEKYLPFAKRLGKRAERVSEEAKVDIEILNNNLFNAYKTWLEEYDKAVGDNRHINDGINILQMKLEILYRSLVGRKFVKVLNKKTIQDTRANVINLFDPRTSTGYVDYRGRIDFQDLFYNNPSQYLAIDFCADLFRDLAKTRGENPFGSAEDIVQLSVGSAVSSLSYAHSHTFFKLMRFKDLPTTKNDIA